MAQTHYIEAEEEVISAIGRLRKTGEVENIFVFPKRALILQSIINLKLLEREAKKLGKKVIVVTQDNEGKLLAEKAGLITEQYNEETMRPEDTTARFTVHHGENIPMPVRGEKGERPLQSSANIGSSTFYSSREGMQSPPPAPPPASPPAALPPRPIRIRDASPPPQTSLNSLRSSQNENPNPLLSSPSSPRLLQENFVPQARPEALHPTIPSFSERQEKLHRFLSGARHQREVPPTLPPLPPRRPPVAPLPPSFSSSAASSSSRTAMWAFILLGCFSVVTILGAILFIFLPQASVFIVPQGATQDSKYQFVGTREALPSSENINTLPARVVEGEKDISLTIDATGEGANQVNKARGTVIISNAFSDAPQSLVATTRFLTSDGKIFRLVGGVTVPGMTVMNGEQKPGAIETSVVADQAGESFNISPTDFTIPGFQGTSKYEKFSAKSTQPMTGGGSGPGSEVKSVSQTDLDGALEKAKANALENFKSENTATLEPGEKLLEESIETTPEGIPLAPTVGTVATTFNYQVRFKIRTFVISEQSIRDFVEKQTVTSSDANSVVLKPVDYSLSYGTPLAHFDEGKVELSVSAKMTLQAPINTDALRSELLGQDEAGIKSVLEKHPEIKRLRVEFKPKIFIASIPKNEKRVSVIITQDNGE